MKIVLTPAFAVLLLIAFVSRASAQAPAPDQPAVGQTGTPPLPRSYAQPQLAPPPPSTPPPPPDATTLPIQNGGVAPSVTGVVKQYLLTPVGDVEGLELQDGTDVRFPPHMGAALAGIVKPGDRINVVGFVGPQTSYGRAIRALTITNTGTNQSVVDQPLTVPPAPPWMRAASMKTMTVSGTLDRYILNDRGDIDGLYPEQRRGGEVSAPYRDGRGNGTCSAAFGGDPGERLRHEQRLWHGRGRDDRFADRGRPADTDRWASRSSATSLIYCG